MISDLAHDALNDAKGSAGDKHETTLSMMHLEQEKLNQKLTEVINQTRTLDKMDAMIVHSKIVLGSVIHTNDVVLYLSTALPKIQLENKTVIAVSPQSPLGIQMLGKIVGDEVIINNNRFQIKTIE